MNSPARELAERIAKAIQDETFDSGGYEIPSSQESWLKDATEVAAALIDSALPKWVAREDRLPEKSDIKWRGVPILAVMRLTNSVKALEYKEHDSGGEWYFFDGKWPYDSEDITHWQFLPAPPAAPREEKQDG